MAIQYEIRKLLVSDLAAFYAVRLAGLEEFPEAFGETVENFKKVTLDALATKLVASAERGGFILGGFDSQGNLLGVGALGRELGEKRSHIAIVWGMYVLPKARKTGLGSQIMKSIVKLAEQTEGIELLHLSVNTNNVAALNLYIAQGFQVYGTETRAIKLGARYCDEHLMARSVGS